MKYGLADTKKHLLDMALRYAEESIMYSYRQEQVFNFDWFKSNMRSKLNEMLPEESEEK